MIDPPRLMGVYLTLDLHLLENANKFRLNLSAFLSPVKNLIIGMITSYLDALINYDKMGKIILICHNFS